MSASGRFHDFAAENCQLRVLIIWLNVSPTKYKVRRWPKLFLFHSQGEKNTRKNVYFFWKNNRRIFPVFLFWGQISVSHSDLLWNNNVVLNGFVIYSNSCLFLFGNTFYLPLSLPAANVTVKCTNAAMLPIQTNAAGGQICYNAMKWTWMRQIQRIRLLKLGQRSIQHLWLIYLMPWQVADRDLNTRRQRQRQR